MNDTVYLVFAISWSVIAFNCIVFFCAVIYSCIVIAGDGWPAFLE